MQAQNRQARPVALLTATVASMFRKEGSPAIDASELLPFPPPPNYLTVEQSKSFFDAWTAGSEVTSGS